MADLPRRIVFSRVLAVVSVLLGGVLAVVALDGDPVAQLGWVLVAAVAVAIGESFVPRMAPAVHLSTGSGLLLAPIALLDARSAVAIALLGVVGGYVVERYRAWALPTNLAVTVLPIALAGLTFEALGAGPADTGAGAAAFAAACAVFVTSSPLLFGVIVSAETGERFRVQTASVLQTARLAVLIDFGFAIGLAYLIAQAGWAGGAIAAVAAGLQLHGGSLVARANDQRLRAEALARAKTALSWGIISALLGTLDARNPNLARHSAAVARLSRRIAAELGLSEHDQDVVHTAGLLHDIGQFASADRVVVDGASPSPQDWRSIREHPRAGYELLREMTEFGPVGEIVLHHHERVDGRGYPDRLAGDEIPLASRIVHVAEAYDAMTGPGTYRTRRSSLEALKELRDHAGRQFDPAVVDALHRVLRGTDHAFRHSDEAHYRDELDVERRIVDQRMAARP